MSGNGRGNMRPTSRSPPFLVVGLLIAMCILAINYWSVSNRNKDLLNQLENLQVDLRSVSDKHLAVEKRASDLSSQAAEFQSMVAKLQSSATEKENKVNVLTDELNAVNSQLEQVRRGQSDAQMHVQEMREEKKSVDEEVGRLKTELENERKKTMVCDKRACNDVVREVMKVMLDSVGKSKVMSAFSLSHADTLSMVDDLLKGATDPPVQQPQANPQSNNQGDVQLQQQQGGQGGVGTQGGEQSENTNVAQNPSMSHNPNAGQNLDTGHIPTMGQVQDTAQNSNAGQNQQVGQNPNPGLNPNVVEMQQQPGAPGQMTPGQGDERGPSQQDLLGVLKQPPQNPDLKDNVASQTQAGEQKPKEEEKGGKQEIVAQNIPQRDGEEVAMSNEDHRIPDLNGAPAQEDVGDNSHMDLPEDEIDRQAIANHGAGDLGNLDDIHDHPQDLSRHQLVNPLDIDPNRQIQGDEDKVDVDQDKEDEERTADRRVFDERDEGTLENMGH